MYDCLTFIREMYKNMVFLIYSVQSLKSTIFLLTFVYVDPVDQAAHATRNNGEKRAVSNPCDFKFVSVW